MASDDPTPEEIDPGFADLLSEIGSSDTAETLIEWPFCFIYGNNIRRDPMKISAPSPELAATTADQLVQRANEIAGRLGYKPLWRCQSGDCS